VLVRIRKQKKFKILLLILVFSFTTSCIEASHKIETGDIFLVSTNEKTYTTWKISKIEKNTIWYICNDYSVSEIGLINSINRSYNYTDSSNSIDKKTFYKRTTQLQDKNLNNEK